jgi:hypothetical protein
MAAWQCMAKVYAELNKHRASAFNIINLLGLQYYESTHSAIIADLLNPEGSHGQMHLFLEAFLEICNKTSPLFPKPSKDIRQYFWFVEKEKSTSFGRLDIVVSCPELKYMFVVENKIWAAEQQDQLERYSHWLKIRKKSFPTSAIIYLTPKGEKSSTGDERDYYRMSYNPEMLSWLDAIIPKIQASRVRETIVQYRETVANL